MSDFFKTHEDRFYRNTAHTLNVGECTFPSIVSSKYCQQRLDTILNGDTCVKYATSVSIVPVQTVNYTIDRKVKMTVTRNVTTRRSVHQMALRGRGNLLEQQPQINKSSTAELLLLIMETSPYKSYPRFAPNIYS